MTEYIILLDRWIFNNMKLFSDNYLFQQMMILVSKLGDSGFIWIITGLVLVLIPKTRKAGIMLFSVLLLNFILNDILLKNLIGRARPFIDFPQTLLLIKAPESFSFPSGHASSAFASAYVLMKNFRKYYIYVFAFLIAFSRIYLNVHYFSDVAAGCVIGTFCGIIVLYLFKKSGDKKYG